MIAITFLDLDIAFEEVKPPTPTVGTYSAKKEKSKKWTRVNKVGTKIILSSFIEMQMIY